MGIATDLSDLKELSDGVVANKVSRFAYTQTAYDENDVDGVIEYDVSQAQNIPVGIPTVMKVNSTVVDKGYRARGSSITRMLLNHFLGRLSYNLNKVNDWFNSLLASLSASLGRPNGIATLDGNGLLAQRKPVGSQYVEITKGFLGAIFQRLLGQYWQGATGKDSEFSMYLASSIMYGGGVWCCAITNKGVWWSSDGKSWHKNTTLPSDACTSLQYVNDEWVVLSGKKVYTSTDGNVWQQVSESGVEINDILYAGDIWVGLSLSSDTHEYMVWWSEDLVTWTQGSISWPATQVGMEFWTYVNGLVFLGVRYVEEGVDERTVYWCADGKTWTVCTMPVLTPLATFKQIAYANNIWVAPTYDNILWSVDGKTWNSGTGTSGSRGWTYVAYANGIWVANNIYLDGAWWSEDGKAWSRGSGITQYTIDFVVYANHVWVACVYSGGGSGIYSLWWSEDGKAWTQCTYSGTLGSLTTPTFANGLWFTGSSGIGTLRSEDGKTWVKVSDIVANHLAFADGQWLGSTGGSTDFFVWGADVESLMADGVIDFGANIPLVNS